MSTEEKCAACGEPSVVKTVGSLYPDLSLCLPCHNAYEQSGELVRANGIIEECKRRLSTALTDFIDRRKAELRNG